MHIAHFFSIAVFAYFCSRYIERENLSRLILFSLVCISMLVNTACLATCCVHAEYIYVHDVSYRYVSHTATL